MVEREGPGPERAELPKDGIIRSVEDHEDSWVLVLENQTSFSMPKDDGEVPKPGDNVKVELTPYELSKGRITFRE